MKAIITLLLFLSFPAFAVHEALNFSDVENYVKAGINSQTAIFGDQVNGNYSEFDKSGRLYFYGAAELWDDLRVPLTTTELGTANAPDFSKLIDNGAGSQGVYTYRFDPNTEEEVFFSSQLPHSYKIGSNIVPHVHWTPTDNSNGNVVWGLEYVWTNIDGVYSNTTLTYVKSPVITSQNKHKVSYFPAIDGTGKKISSMLECRFFRASGNSNDDYGADASVSEFDFHYIMDSLGSRNENHT